MKGYDSSITSNATQPAAPKVSTVAAVRGDDGWYRRGVRARAHARHVRAKERALGREDGQNGEMGQNEPGGLEERKDTRHEGSV